MGNPMIRIASPEVGAAEVAAVRRVVLSGQLAGGPEVERFEGELAERLGVREAVALMNGTVALELALIALGIGRGDEVVTTPLTFFATASSIIRTGATPVLADIDPSSYNVDPGAVLNAITPRTAAIVAVHLYGRPCDMDELRKVTKAHSLALIEDACQAIGAKHRGKSAGSFGTGCFSFYGSKNIMSGEGGAVVTSDARVARRVRMLRNQGSVRQYVHESVSANFRMTDMQAAVLRVQLDRLDRITARRQANARLYDRLLDSPAIVRPLPNDAVYESAYHQYTLRVPGGKRRSVRQRLWDRGIETRVYYPRLVHQQPAWSYPLRAYPNAERACREIVSIPVHTALRRHEIVSVVGAVNEAAAK